MFAYFNASVEPFICSLKVFAIFDIKGNIPSPFYFMEYTFQKLLKAGTLGCVHSGQKGAWSMAILTFIY